jgi:hypothetical protein
MQKYSRISQKIAAKMVGTGIMLNSLICHHINDLTK